MKLIEKETQKRTMVQLALREVLMRYYKGVSPDPLVKFQQGVSLHDMPCDSQFQYQRQLRDLRKHQVLTVADIPIAELLKNPSEFKVVVDKDRSPIMQEFVGGITVFLAEYLPGVEVKHEPSEIQTDDDSKFYSSIKVSLANGSQSPMDAAYERVQRWTASTFEPLQPVYYPAVETAEGPEPDPDFPF